MGMQHAIGRRVSQVNPRMDVEGRRLPRPFSFDHRAVGVDQMQAAGRDLGPVKAVGIEQEAIALARQGKAEVVVDSLVEPEAHRQPQGRREVHARVADRLAVFHPVLPFAPALSQHRHRREI
jgi:hypothetical protein